MEENKKINGFCITAMILGIVALVFCCVWFISIPCAILGLVFGILGIKKIGKGMAIAGIVTSGIALALYVLTFIGAFIGGFLEGFSSML